MKTKKASRKKTSPARARTKPAKKPAAKAPARTTAAKAAAPAPRPTPYTPKPIEGMGWAPFRYTR
ncbi:MAG: hypothetical protein ACREK9_09770 [Candidatus Rokuibacteriota bacterium]